MDIVKDGGEPLVMLKQAEIADLFKIGRRTLWRWISTGQFPPPDLREGRVVRWSAATVAAWADGRKPNAK